MWMTVLLSIAIFGAAVALMSIGVIFGKRSLRASCGGSGAGGCEVCGRGEGTQCKNGGEPE
jgi:hypothetical protein